MHHQLQPTGIAHVFVLHPYFHLPQLDVHRKIWCYLPPSYWHHPHKHYPVIYMQDGQNLFDPSLSYAGAWHVAESMSFMAARKQAEAIIVGIENGGQKRVDEYGPWKRRNGQGGKGRQYAEALIYSLKPFIDSNLRTLADRSHTGIIGSSMGGLISLYAGLAYPHIFGSMGILSPSLWFSNEIYALAASRVQYAQRIYFSGSQTESKGMGHALYRLQEALKAGGHPSQLLKGELRQRGRHNERFWAKEFKHAYRWMSKEW